MRRYSDMDGFACGLSDSMANRELDCVLPSRHGARDRSLACRNRADDRAYWTCGEIGGFVASPSACVRKVSKWLKVGWYSSDTWYRNNSKIRHGIDIRDISLVRTVV